MAPGHLVFATAENATDTGSVGTARENELTAVGNSRGDQYRAVKCPRTQDTSSVDTFGTDTANAVRITDLGG
jgi:hypothetical protein